MTKTRGQKESRKHENRLAKKVGGRRQVASGAFWSNKGDVRAEDVLIEHKWTGKASISIKAQVLEKIFREAWSESRMPVLGFHLNGKNYVVLDEDDFLEMRDNLQEHKNCLLTTKDQKSGDTKPSAAVKIPSSGFLQEIKQNTEK